LGSASGLYYKPMMIVNDDSRVVIKLETSLTDDARVINYDHRFIVQATDGCSSFLIYFFKQPKELEWITNVWHLAKWHLANCCGNHIFSVNKSEPTWARTTAHLATDNHSQAQKATVFVVVENFFKNVIVNYFWLNFVQKSHLILRKY